MMFWKQRRLSGQLPECSTSITSHYTQVDVGAVEPTLPIELHK